MRRRRTPVETGQAGISRLGSSVLVDDIVKKTIYYKPDDGTTIFVLGRGDDKWTVKGKYPFNPEGCSLCVKGVVVDHEKYGRQLSATRIEPGRDALRSEIETHLVAQSIPGLDRGVARVVVQAYPQGWKTVLDRSPELLVNLPGVPERLVAYLCENKGSISRKGNLADFMVLVGIPEGKLDEIIESYGVDAEYRIRKNPWSLCRKLKGFGFRTSDEVAKKLDFPRDCRERMAGAIDAVLAEAGADGICGEPVNRVVVSASRLSGLSGNEIEDTLLSMILEGEVSCETLGKEEVIYPGAVARADRVIAEGIANAGSEPPWDVPTLQSDFSRRRSSELTLGRDQEKAVHVILGSGMSIMTGGPGVGKTTTLKTALDILEARGVTMRLCAPTGMAARRMKEATGRNAQTIHKLIGQEEQFRNGSNYTTEEAGPMDVDFLVVDEFSMADVFLAARIFKMKYDRTALLFVGDVDQLPSVGPGRVLHDMISSGEIPVSSLREVFRQGKDSMIISAAHAVNSGELPETPPDDIHPDEREFYFIPAPGNRPGGDGKAADLIVRMVSENIPGLLQRIDAKRIDDNSVVPQADPLRDILVLSPMRAGSSGVKALNLRLREALNPLPDDPGQTMATWSAGSETTFHAGDKVINTLNREMASAVEERFEKIVNGDIGFIRSVDSKAKTAVIDFDGRLVRTRTGEFAEIELAYAITIHKSQGSEARCVVMPMVEAHDRMLARNLVYTGITRAKEICCVVGNEDAFRSAVLNTRNQERRSFTAEAIRQAVLEIRSELEYEMA